MPLRRREIVGKSIDRKIEQIIFGIGGKVSLGGN